MPTMKIRENKINNVKDELAEEEGEAKQSTKKGPWTAAEDAILIEYVNKYGEGNWNSVQKNSGLSRCGKSCRLRWANHLRPNLKKGAFSQHEQQIIIELHAKLGNKWARMASQLPGRTDNEIKNFWNTRMKRRQRAGLPLYPPEVQDEDVVYQQYSAPPPPQPQPQSHPSSFSFTSLLSSSSYDHHTLNYSDSAYDDTTHQLYKQSLGMGVPPPPIYSVSPYGFNYGFDSRMLNTTTTTTTEMTSSTTQSQTPASSYTPHAFMGGSSINHLEYYEAEGNSSGLLDDLVVEAQALNKPNTKSSADSTAGRKRKSMADEQHPDAQTQRDDLSSSQSSTGKKAIGEKDPMEEMNSMDDDLFSLLNNYPSEIPMPEWYRKGQNQSLQHEEHASPPHTTDQELAWTLGTCWNNMPTIC